MQATSSHGLPACRCQINRPLAFRGHRACEYVASDATTACFNPAQASHADAGWTVSPFANSTCCAHHPEHTTGNGCLLRESHRHEPCAWDGGQRIAWLHIPKTGTSMLLWLARLANASLPSSARLVPHKPSRKTLLWEIFFRRWRPTEWFHGSSIFWRAGIEHAVISEAEYGSYRGRFFALFRDPRERGWSSYYHFANGSIGEEGSRSRVTPEQYAADCLRGTAVGMLAGQMRMGPFGSLDCHAVTNFSGLAPACGKCRRAVACARRPISSDQMRRGVGSRLGCLYHAMSPRSQVSCRTWSWRSNA